MSDTGHIPTGGPSSVGQQASHDPFGADGSLQQGVVRPPYTFLDQPDGLDEDEDELLMPGPQGSWGEPVLREPIAPVLPEYQSDVSGSAPVYAPVFAPQFSPEPAVSSGPAVSAVPAAAAVPLADPLTDPLPAPLTDSGPVPVPVPEGFAMAAPAPEPAPAVAPVFTPEPAAAPVDTAAPGAQAEPPAPSWPPLMPPGAPQAPQPVVEPVTAAESAQPAVAPPRRPLHAGPPIPDPSMMTGQVPVRSLADRGPSSHGESVFPAGSGAGVAGAQQQGPEYLDQPGTDPAQPQSEVRTATRTAVQTAVQVEAPPMASATEPLPTVPAQLPSPASTLGGRSLPEPPPTVEDAGTLALNGLQAGVVQPTEAAAVEVRIAETEVQVVEPQVAETAPTEAPTPAPQPAEPVAAEPVASVPVEAVVPPEAAPTPVAAEPIAVAPVEAAPAAEAVPVPVPAPVPAPVAEPVVQPEALPADRSAPVAEAVPAAETPAASPVEVSAPVQTPAPRGGASRIAAFMATPSAHLADVIPEPSAAPEQPAAEPVAAEATAVGSGLLTDQNLAGDAQPGASDLPAQAQEQEQEQEPAAVTGTEAEVEVEVEVPTEPEPEDRAAAVAAADTVTDTVTESQPEVQPGAEAGADADPEPAAPVPALDADAEPGSAPDADPADEVEPEEAREPLGPAAPAYDDDMREAVHRVMRERRDIRNGFRSDPVPHDVLLRVLEAAHTAPSVGYSQPWDFVVIRSAKTRTRMHELAERQRDAYAESLPKGRAKQFKELKIEAILETPVNIVVTADRTRGGRHTLGRHTQPQMAPYSAALAVENLWLAARAEGLGVGWVSFFDEQEMVRELGLPEHLDVVAYLCVGYVNEFPSEPELAQAGWAKKRPLSWVVHEETYGRRALPGEEPHSVLQETLRGIRPLDAKALGEAWDRQKRMTKPAGSLGMLEIISAQLCGLSRKCPPPIPEPACVAVFAGDHGVHAQGVTHWPQEVTAQMVANFLAGGAVVNAFATQLGAEVCVVDVGVASELPAAIESGRTTGLLPRKVRPGTDDMTTGPAMSREDALRAIEVGIETARDLVAAGNKALITGDMGIANTTPAAALIAVFTGEDPSVVTGRGTGIDDETHARKVAVIRAALELHRPDPSDPIGVLAAVGGLEHAALAGFMLGAASLRTPVILDGVIAGAAALVAKAIAPEVLAACIAGHRSAEPGHKAALAKLGLRPLIDLDLRLGEGSGALLALPLVQSAARAMHDVATFDSAGVTEKH